MEASKVTIEGKTYDWNYLGKKKKTNLRRKVIIEYIQSKPAGEIIKMGEFQQVAHFALPANADAFVKRMIRDGVICRYNGDKPRSYYYSVTGAVRVRKPAEIPEPQLPAVIQNNPDINGFIADMQKLGVEFSITITNKKG